MLDARRDQHRRGALRRARHAARAVSARRRRRRRRRGRRPARRVRHRGASRFARSRRCAGRDDRAPIDGIEWLNTDSEWRGESRAPAGAGRRSRTSCGRAGAGDAVRSSRDARSLGSRSTQVRAPVVALAAADAHGGVGRARRGSRAAALSGMVGIPSYEASFRAFSNRVVLERPLSGNAAADARAIYGAIRKGSVFTAIDALAGAGARSTSTSKPAWSGSRWAASLPDDSDATIVARASMPPGAELVLLRDGREVATGRGEIRRARDRGARRLPRRSPAPGRPGRRRRCRGWSATRSISAPMRRVVPTVPPRALGAACRCPADRAVPVADRKGPGVERHSSDRRDHEVDARVQARRRASATASSSRSPPTFSGRRSRAIDLSLAGDRPLRVSVQVRARGRRAVGAVVSTSTRPARALRSRLPSLAADRRPAPAPRFRRPT